MLVCRAGVSSTSVFAAVVLAVVVGAGAVYFEFQPLDVDGTSGTSSTTTKTSWSGSDHPNVNPVCASGTYLADHDYVQMCPSGYAPANATQGGSKLCMSAENVPVSVYDLARLQVSDDNGRTVYLIVPDVPLVKVDITGGDYNTLFWYNVSTSVIEGITTVSAIPKTTTEVAGVGDIVSTFTILSINQTAVEGNYSIPYPLCCRYQIMFVHVGDDIGIQCAGLSEVLQRIDVVNEVAVFNRTVSETPPGGCPICLSGDTVIDTPVGQVNVKDMMTGMLVWSVDASGDKIVATVTAVRQTSVPQDDQIIRVILQDGRQLYVSPGHPTADGRLFGQLRVGDSLDGSTILIYQLIPYNQPFTYDLLPSGPTGYYWANGVLVGSTLSQLN